MPTEDKDLLAGFGEAPESPTVLDLTALDDEGAARTLSRLIDQMTAARSQVETAQRRVDGIRKVIDGLVEMFPALWESLPEDLDGDEERPRGSEAVLRVLNDHKGDWYVVGGVVGMLEREGWAPNSANPANAVRTALERLHERGLVKKSKSTKGQVIYQVPKPTGYGSAGYSEDEEPF